MLKKKVSLREFLLIAVLILFIAYYFAVQVPVSRDTQELESKQAEVQCEIDIAIPQLAQMRAMEKAVENLDEQSGEVQPLPEYNNINNLLNELHSILGSEATTYSIDFATESVEEPITSRVIPISFNAPSYDTAMKIIESINNSPNRYLINSLSIYKESKGDTGDYTVNMNLICFEYKG